ncbi:hypothetical protein GKD00_05130 [Lactobacillus ruminis]|jgi:hypothetical protein|uniref:hypothetical protein n=1 Tax=Ligilactobacillus ruminis TaxID=1623 RepID=UPI00101EC333|nr:hypothetical protein [Ligilactobacillus ruminis]MSB43616.1 hypothetical protein [Ligilactobacillus ruminis]MSB54613.1 hypothetical protein [Ligilactobacillus ruminis]MSB56304.1 hypothetical protein [Ligilactobacillus ruminis]MSB81352.1 hypothetical protein [Ligilactobacillus ruminis]MSB91148.1 hypothetical protein [Ligilactobacillus ruminis]
MNKKEKAVIISVKALGALMAMAGTANWKTENTAKIAADIALLIDDVDDVDIRNELKAYIVAFGALEMQAHGEDAKEMIDGAQEAFGDEVLEKVLKKIEEIESARRKRK